jgi:Fe-S-cluster containining protein
MATQKKWIKVGALKVDSHLLEVRPVARCRVEECQAGCCGHGVDVDLAHASRIVEEADLIKPLLPVSRQNLDDWFDGAVARDADFPSGHRVGTEVVTDPHHPAGTRCVFLRPDNRCALQLAGITAGRHPWDLKPYFCALYPIVLLGDTLELDDENEVYLLGGSCQRAEPVPTPLYELFKDELLLAMGQQGYDELCSLARARSGVKG